MKTQIEWLVISADGLPVSAWPNDPDEWCWGAKTGCSSDLCGGCAYCLEMQARHADCEVKYVMAPENPDQIDLFGPTRLTFWQRYKDPIIIATSVIGFLILYLLLLICYIIFAAGLPT